MDATNVSEGKWPGAAPSSGYGISALGQGRSPPYASEPPQKKPKSATGEQGGLGYEYPPGKDYQSGGSGGDAGVGYAVVPGSQGHWSGSELGYTGAANGGWYCGYAPGAAPLGFGANPSMNQNTPYGLQNVGYGAPSPSPSYGQPYGGASAATLTGNGGGSISTSRFFHKTRLCTKFSIGACTFGARCNFAHGMEDMRKPPPGWEGLRSSQGSDGGGRGPVSQPYEGGPWGSVGKTRLCRIYHSEGSCHYGENCSFLHDVEGLQPRDPSALSGSIGTGGDDQAAGRPSNWKTQICRRWGATGQCSFGENCHFAHGASELRVYGSSPVNAFAGSGFSVASYPNASNVMGSSLSSKYTTSNAEDKKIPNGDGSGRFVDGLNGKEV